MAEQTPEVPDLDAARRGLVSAFNRQDFAAVAATFAAEATLLPPGTRMVRSGESIQQFWASVGEQVNEIAMEPVDVHPLAHNSAREVGRMRMRLSERPQPVLHKYLLVWEKNGENWLIESFSWNRIRLAQQGSARMAQNPQSTQPGPPEIPKLYSG